MSEYERDDVSYWTGIRNGLITGMILGIIVGSCGLLGLLSGIGWLR